jgi:hypothetical protein
MKQSVVQAINSNATRIGMVHGEEPRARAARQLALLRALRDVEDSRLLQILEDMPAGTAAELETIFVLVEVGT